MQAKSRGIVLTLHLFEMENCSGSDIKNYSSPCWTLFAPSPTTQILSNIRVGRNCRCRYTPKVDTKCWSNSGGQAASLGRRRPPPVTPLPIPLRYTSILCACSNLVCWLQFDQLLPTRDSPSKACAPNMSACIAFGKPRGNKHRTKWAIIFRAKGYIVNNFNLKKKNPTSKRKQRMKFFWIIPLKFSDEMVDTVWKWLKYCT